ncbi:MAG: FecR domain-containing protein [Niabella sp.]
MDRIPENMFFRLFARKLSGNASAEELEQLEEILKQHPELQFFYDELIKPAQPHERDLERAEQSYIADVMNMQLRGVWDNDNLVPPKRSRPGATGKIYRLAVAAAIAIVLVGGFALTKITGKKGTPHTSNETATTKGSKSTVKLPDGTVVMLNANSRLQYDESFNKMNRREVILEGEAYFDVAHNEERPFIIHTKSADVTVLGTVFNVKTLQNGYFETALIKGKVAIHLKNQAEGNFVLNPGQKLIVGDKNESDKTAGENKISAVRIDTITLMDSLVVETSWTQNQLVFADKPLVEIAEELEQVFGVKIIFRSDRAKQVRYNGAFSDADLDEIMKILNMAKPINYQREKDSIIIE